MARVVWDRDAEADLDEIWAYIAKDSVRAANRFIHRIGEQCRFLAEQPETGQFRPELAPNLRSFSVGKYIIFFRPAEDGIQVARVLHGARDIETQF